MSVCKQCGINDDEAFLVKCPICHQMVCEEDKYSRSGRTFCTEYCAAMFFHGDSEDGATEDD